MNGVLKSARVIAALLVTGLLLRGEPDPARPSSAALESLLTELRQRSNRNQDTATSRERTAAVADPHLPEILAASGSAETGLRVLAAQLLAYTTKNEEGTAAVIRLASDASNEVRMAALETLPVVTSGSDPAAAAAVMRGLSNFDDTAMVREAALTASQLKLPAALPVLEKLLKTGNLLNKRSALTAVAHYGQRASALLPEIKREYAETSDIQLKILLGRAVSALSEPAPDSGQPAGPAKPGNKFRPDGALSTRSQASSPEKSLEAEPGDAGKWWIGGAAALVLVALTIVIMRALRGKRWK